VVSFTSQPLYPQGKSSWYPLDRRLDGPQSCSGHSGEEEGYQTADNYTFFMEKGMLITNQGQNFLYIIESFQQLKG
jgi:hypothetical protein